MILAGYAASRPSRCAVASRAWTQPAPPPRDGSYEEDGSGAVGPGQRSGGRSPIRKQICKRDAVEQVESGETWQLWREEQLAYADVSDAGRDRTACYV
jgi:hypothetical protein